ncbi:MAG: hypothetical protein JGK17_24545 [Microcoleus sp. PH2017_10_PVI_O_A]|uniref:hypothetical protein n=1 Tax=Microcoleus sp. PH2017_10_PVI_O_A TaxID=2798821 RepID=UPI001D4418AA|nr:hypothetical protein [Microcoleus sp. PH2017_10_PVI_O_A]MCC3408688.1 hypothetical protein [Microcoleus sp. PH2017_10_PVI_O_A]
MRTLVLSWMRTKVLTTNQSVLSWMRKEVLTTNQSVLSWMRKEVLTSDMILPGNLESDLPQLEYLEEHYQIWLFRSLL